MVVLNIVDGKVEIVVVAVVVVGFVKINLVAKVVVCL